MNNKLMKILNFISGILLIAIGIYCICNQDVAVLTAGMLVGVFMLVSGLGQIFIFISGADLLLGSGWLLLDGILTVILSLFLLFNQWFTMVSLPFLFTSWLLFSGISRFVSAFDLKALNVRYWSSVLIIGIILVIAGIVCMMDPFVSVMAVGFTVGFVFILQGISSIIYLCIAKK